MIEVKIWKQGPQKCGQQLVVGNIAVPWMWILGTENNGFGQNFYTCINPRVCIHPREGMWILAPNKYQWKMKKYTK